MKEKHIYPFTTKSDGIHYYISHKQPHTQKQRHYGTYKTLEEAIIARDQLIQHEWDETKCTAVRVRRTNKDKRDKHIIYRNGIYSVVKSMVTDGKRDLVIFDTGIRTLEEARELRDWWVEHDWSWEEAEGQI